MLTLTLGCGFVMAQSAGSAGRPLLLPNQPDAYVDYAVNNLPAHFGTEVGRDNTPGDNPITDAGATLGRVLFYDKRLSHNNSMACSSCHFQENGFSDPRPQSVNSDGTLSERHSMALSNGKFYSNGRFLSDESAGTLEEQVLLPITSPELGMDLGTLNGKLANAGFYDGLFSAAFGTPDVTTDRVSKALSQFVRSMVSYDSKFDSIFNAAGQADVSQLTAMEQHGLQVFNGAGRCATCHESNSQITDQVHNNGLDAFTDDPGAGDATFKAASLRNAEVRGAFMHDGRFTTLEEVVEFYNSGIQDHPDLDFRLRENFELDGAAVSLNLDANDIDGLIAFLRTLTDNNFLTDPKFSDPFVLDCDFDGDGTCGVGDLDLMLAIGPLVDGVAVDPSNVAFDLNGDGQVDGADVQEWLALAAESNGFGAAYHFGDTNLDGLVDVSDFNAWNQNKFSASTSWSQGDFNFDGVVDASDFNLWNGSKFTSLPDFNPANAVPEPNAFSIMLFTVFVTFVIWGNATRTREASVKRLVQRS